MASQHQDDFAMVANPDDIYNSREHRKLAASYDLEGSNLLLKDSSMGQPLARSGVRPIQAQLETLGEISRKLKRVG
ncbi:hypothetical protein GIR22_09215 [Pseudomonas sp. CCM 7891]|uniref:Uncharacterized protein n=1 Tax=Pseudomonas karstica TaxID=1055468 RepID=A0A7X2RQN1_9PSED|nr:membrane dipeptidase [Pseudomonas karstica]MTD19322.1 hypothetical protein [Pseudomonas karstica]